MAKRKAPPRADSDFEASASELSDYTPSSSKPKSTRGVGRKRTKRADSDEGLVVEAADTFDLSAHDASQHTIGTRASPIQSALLA